MKTNISMLLFVLFATFFGSMGSLYAAGTKLDRPIVEPAPGSVTSGYTKWKCAYSSTVAGDNTILDGAGVAEGTVVTGDVTAISKDGTKTVYNNVQYIVEGTLKRICARAAEKAPATVESRESPRTIQDFEKMER